MVGADADEATRALLYRESGGNPFYVEQLARASRLKGLRGASGTRRSHGAVPRAVIAAINEELLAVSAESRLVLEAAAIAGEPFEPELIAEIAQRDVANVLAALDELLAVDLIRSTDAPRRFRFRHPIVRGAVYDRLPRGWQIGAHARAATALAAAHAPASVRAHHVEGSATMGDEEAISLLVDAGREAAARAPEAAGRWLLSATRLLPPNDSGDRRLSLLAEAASALTFAGAYDEALAVLGEAGDLLPEERIDERASLVAKIALAKRMSGRPFESRELVEQTLQSLPPECGGALILTLELALDHYWRGEFAADARHRCRCVRPRSRSRPRADRLLGRGAVQPGEQLDEPSRRRAGPPSNGRDQFRRGLRRGARGANRRRGYIAQAASALERIDDALEHARRGLRVAQSTGQSPLIPGLFVLEANALFMKGRIADAVAVAETAADAGVLTGNDQVAIWALWADAMVCSCAGDTARALMSAREAVARSECVTETYFSSLSRLHLGAALQAAGDAATARLELAAFEAGPNQGLLDLRGAHGWDLLIRAQLALGDLTGADACAATAEARARATGLPQRTATALCARAAVLLAREEAAAAADVAREAILLAGATDNPLLSARAQAMLGSRAGPHRPRRSGDRRARVRRANAPRMRGAPRGRRRHARATAIGAAATAPYPERPTAGGYLSAQPTRAGSRSNGRLRSAKSGRGSGTVPQRKDGREPSRPDLRQARGALPRSPGDDHRQHAHRRRRASACGGSPHTIEWRSYYGARLRSGPPRSRARVRRAAVRGAGAS